MSCDILPKEHIDVMCWAAAEFGRRLGEYPRDAMTVRHPDGRLQRIQLVSGAHPDEEGMTELGQILMEGNYRSVNARYGEGTEVPDYRWEPPSSGEWSCEEVLRAVDCYGYQSCEAPGWFASAAWDACEFIKRVCVEGIVVTAERRCEHGFSWAIGPDTEPAREDPASALAPAVTRADARAGRGAPFTAGQLRLIDDAIRGLDVRAGREEMAELVDDLRTMLESVEAAADRADGAPAETVGIEAPAPERVGALEERGQ